VIGAGIVGAAIAYGLARLGRRVTLLDEGDDAFRASRGNFALVWLQTKGFGMPDYSRWTQRSVALWPEFADLLRQDTAIDVALEQRGGFMLYLDEDGLASHVRKLAELHGQLGDDRFPVETLGHNAVRRMIPAVGPEVVGGTFCPRDGHVNALRLLRALHEGCRRRGVAYRASTAVSAIRNDRGAFVLETPAGQLRAPRIVLAAGLGNARLGPMVGLNVPVRPERGQVIVTEKLERFLDFPLGTVRQTDDGGVMIGASKEDAGFDTATTAPVLADLASDAVRMFPVLARARVVRTWGALRIMSPDGFPIYEESASCPGAFVVTCHSGVSLAAAHALDLAHGLAAGALAPRLAVFTSSRFGHVPQAR
jgi:glycine/D-amino acid oxidase-like deaminating enzyme